MGMAAEETTTLTQQPQRSQPEVHAEANLSPQPKTTSI